MSSRLNLWDITLSKIHLSSVQFSSVAQSCPTVCNPMNRSMPGLPAHHQLLEFTQTHVHRVSDYHSSNNRFLLALYLAPVVWVFHSSSVYCHYLNHVHKLWCQILKVTAALTRLKQASCIMLELICFLRNRN